MVIFMRKKILIISAVIALIFGTIGVFLIANNHSKITDKNNAQNASESIKKDEVKKMTDFDFKYISNKTSQVKDTYIGKYEQHDMYYHTTETELYVCEKDECHTIIEALDKKMLKFEEVLKKSKSSDFAYDGGSGIYYYDDFNIVVCHKQKYDVEKKTTDYNENVYIGNKKLKEVNICK